MNTPLPDHAPVIVPRTEHCISRSMIHPDALRVMYRLKEQGYMAYLAGGGVRDLLLHRKPKDFDIVTDAHPNQVKHQFRNCRLVGRRFRLAHVMYGQHVIEVSTFRANLEPEAPDSEEQAPPAHAFQMRDGLILRDNVYGTPEQDAWRRDFTVNALFYDIKTFSVIDYVGGLQDLQKRTLRVIGDPQTRFREDPVRMIRALRFAAILDFEIEPAADQAITDMRECLQMSSPARLNEELLKLFACGSTEVVFQHLFRTGLFGILFPDMAAWLATPEGQYAHHWLTRALRQVDIWKNAGKPVRPGLIWALLFGPSHEAQAAGLQQEGMAPIPSLDIGTTDILRKVAGRVQIPKHIIRESALIVSAQPRFERTRGKTERFMERPYFEDALIYFKFSATMTGQKRELAEWWQTRWLAHH